MELDRLTANSGYDDIELFLEKSKTLPSPKLPFHSSSESIFELKILQSLLKRSRVNYNVSKFLIILVFPLQHYLTPLMLSRNETLFDFILEKSGAYIVDLPFGGT